MIKSSKMNLFKIKAKKNFYKKENMSKTLFVFKLK